jgi:pyruvate, orthophosphate dikinase
MDLLKVIEVATGKAFPTDPREHLIASIEAVFRSWNSERATSISQARADSLLI